MQKSRIFAGLLALVLLLALAACKPDEGERQEAVVEGDWNELRTGGTITVLLGEELVPMELNCYIWGVLAAEMPATFEKEALKAQAVAARTYTLKKVNAGNTAHPEADICGDFRCCQAYISPERAAENWGDNAPLYREKLRQAVVETGTEVLLHDGALISAFFHSSTSGSTLDSGQVWMQSLPYLQPVESPEGDEVPNYHSTAVISAQEVKQTVLSAYSKADLSGPPETWFQSVETGPGGSVVSITIGGIPMKGEVARSLFNLRSSAFTVSATPDEVTFYATGFGHGVGMSQYGANAMAFAGKDYKEILTHYYTGVTLEPCPEWFLPQQPVAQETEQAEALPGGCGLTEPVTGD